MWTKILIKGRNKNCIHVFLSYTFITFHAGLWAAHEGEFQKTRWRLILPGLLVEEHNSHSSVGAGRILLVVPRNEGDDGVDGLLLLGPALGEGGAPHHEDDGEESGAHRDKWRLLACRQPQPFIRTTFESTDCDKFRCLVAVHRL